MSDINPQELGELKAEVASLRRDLEEINAGHWALRRVNGKTVVIYSARF